MKKDCVLIPVLALSLLCGCAAGAVEPTASPEPTPEAHDIAVCRVVDGAETGELLLAEESGGVYALSLGELAQLPELADLTDGMMVNVHHSGMIMETYPAQFGGVFGVSVAREEETDDRCGLYLQVLEDLWNEDPGLNGDGLSYLGMDLSGLTGLTQGEKNALTWRFAQLRGLSLLTGTFDQLVEQGYITGTPLEGGEHLFYEWPDGILFSLTGSAEEGFQAQKWRSGLGAYYFTGCTAQMDETGGWSYEIGAHAIS